MTKLVDKLGLGSAPAVSYIVCGMPRSGGGALCDLLTQTRLAGRPLEYFRHWFKARWKPDDPSPEARSWALPPVPYFRKIFEDGTLNKVLGIGASYEHFSYVMWQLETAFEFEAESVGEVWNSLLPNLHYIYITREDKIRHAVSWARCAQPSNQDNPLTFDAKQIAGFYQQIHTFEISWEEFFRLSDVTPLRIKYETLFSDYARTVIDVLDYLSVDHPPALSASIAKPDPQNELVEAEWAARFAESFHGLNPEPRTSIQKTVLLPRENDLLKRLGVASIPRISYMICTTHRTGSSLFCEVLKLCRLAGIPKEWFLNWYLSEQSPERMNRADGPDAKEWLRPPKPYLRKVFRRATLNGVFGVKMMQEYFPFVINRLREFLNGEDLPDIEALKAVFPNCHFVYLTRENKIRQAVSHAKAVQTDVWHSFSKNPTGSNEQDLSSQTNDPGTERAYRNSLAYDFDQIHGLYRTILDSERAWENFFEKSGIEPHRVTYESFVNSPEPTVAGLLDYLQIYHPAPLVLFQPARRPLSDSLNAEWIDRFTADLEMLK